MMSISLLKNGFYTIHAAALSREGRAILFPATQGGGKSTIAFFLLQNGFKLLGDDTVLVRKTARSIKISYLPPKIFGIRDGSLRFFPWLLGKIANKSVPLVKRGSGYYFPIERLIPGCYENDAELSSIVFPIVRRNKTEIVKLNKEEAISELKPCFRAYGNEEKISKDILNSMVNCASSFSGIHRLFVTSSLDKILNLSPISKDCPWKEREKI